MDPLSLPSPALFELGPGALALVAATFFLAGLVKGVTGMGLPTVAMGLLGAFLSPLAAAGLLLVPSLITNLWQLAAGPHFGALARRLWPMMLAISVGTLFGSTLLTGGDAGFSTGALGLTLALYAGAALLLPPFRLAPRWEPVASPLAGLLTGLVTGATGVFVLPAVPFLQSLDLSRDDLVQALGLSFTVSTLALGAGLLWHGGLAGGDMLGSALAVLPAVAGLVAGQLIRTRIAPPLFRKVFLIGLLVLGLEMAARPLL